MSQITIRKKMKRTFIKAINGTLVSTDAVEVIQPNGDGYIVYLASGEDGYRISKAAYELLAELVHAIEADEPTIDGDGCKGSN
jgi:hypothetical protein